MSLRAVLVLICWVFASVADDASKAAPARDTAVPGAAVMNSTGTSRTNSSGTNTHGKSHGGLFTGFGVDKLMIQRGLYVLIATTLVGLLYFLIRAVRLKKPVQKKKYGLLSNYDDSVEMEAVESDEDDTLYEARSLRR